MELTAVVEGLASLDEPCRVQIVTDSDYVNRGITALVQKWATNAWRSTSGSGRVSNKRLWQRLISVAEPHEIDCRWVAGHSGHEENEFVDRLAREAAETHHARNSSCPTEWVVPRATVSEEPATR